MEGLLSSPLPPQLLVVLLMLNPVTKVNNMFLALTVYTPRKPSPIELQNLRVRRISEAPWAPGPIFTTAGALEWGMKAGAVWLTLEERARNMSSLDFLEVTLDPAGLELPEASLRCLEYLKWSHIMLLHKFSTTDIELDWIQKFLFTNLRTTFFSVESVGSTPHFVSWDSPLIFILSNEV